MVPRVSTFFGQVVGLGVIIQFKLRAQVLEFEEYLGDKFLSKYFRQRLECDFSKTILILPSCFPSSDLAKVQF